MKEKLAVEEDGPTGIDLVVDTSGAETCIQMGVLIARRGGTFVQVRIVIMSFVTTAGLSFYRTGGNGVRHSCDANHRHDFQRAELQRLFQIRCE